MIIAAPTVEHSGTRFVIDLFAGFAHRYPLQGVEPGVDTLVQAHFGQAKEWGAFEGILDRHDPPVVIPLRRLHALFLSWERRGKWWRDLDHELAMMVNMIDRDPYWLPIDATDREEWLDAINAGLGLTLDTDWPIIGSDKRTAGQAEDEIVDQAGYRILRDKFDWFFEQVYRANVCGTPPHSSRRRAIGRETGRRSTFRAL